MTRRRLRNSGGAVEFAAEGVFEPKAGLPGGGHDLRDADVGVEVGVHEFHEGGQSGMINGEGLSGLAFVNAFVGDDDLRRRALSGDESV